MALRYFFEARVTVPQPAWEKFLLDHRDDAAAANVADAGALLVKLLEGAGLRLAHGPLFKPTADYPYYVFYNFWEIGENANGLAEAERKLADKVIWATFIKLLERTEDKDLMYPLTERIQDARPNWDVQTGKYVRVQYDLQHYAVAEMKARLDAELAREGRRLGWFLGSSYLLHTGREGQMVQVWLVPPGTTWEHAMTAVGSFSWLRNFQNGSPILKAPAPHESGAGVRLLDRSPFDHSLARFVPNPGTEPSLV